MMFYFFKLVSFHFKETNLIPATFPPQILAYSSLIGLSFSCISSILSTHQNRYLSTRWQQYITSIYRHLVADHCGLIMCDEVLQDQQLCRAGEPSQLRRDPRRLCADLPLWDQFSAQQPLPSAAPRDGPFLLSRRLQPAEVQPWFPRCSQCPRCLTVTLCLVAARRCASPVLGSAALSQLGCFTCWWCSFSTSASTWQNGNPCWLWGTKQAGAACGDWSSTRDSTHVASTRTGWSSSPWQTPRVRLSLDSLTWSRFIFYTLVMLVGYSLTGKAGEPHSGQQFSSPSVSIFNLIFSLISSGSTLSPTTFSLRSWQAIIRNEYIFPFSLDRVTIY